MIAALATPLAQAGPVIPNFGRGDECIRNNGNFCLHWFLDNFGDRYLPRVIEHIEMTLIAISIGFVIAFGAALIAFRYERFELPFANLSALFYTVPSIAFFQIMVPITGIGWTTSQCSTTFPFSKRKMSTTAMPRSSGFIRTCEWMMA